MELTPEEEKLIQTLREIDRVNPLGIDGYTEGRYLALCLNTVLTAPEEAGRRYRLFIEESKRTPLVDLTEAQRFKARYEDTRARPESRAEYEENYAQWHMPQPIWKNDPARIRSIGTGSQGAGRRGSGPNR